MTGVFFRDGPNASRTWEDSAVLASLNLLLWAMGLAAFDHGLQTRYIMASNGAWSGWGHRPKASVSHSAFVYHTWLGEGGNKHGKTRVFLGTTPQEFLGRHENKRAMPFALQRRRLSPEAERALDDRRVCVCFDPDNTAWRRLLSSGLRRHGIQRERERKGQSGLIY